MNYNYLIRKSEKINHGTANEIPTTTKAPFNGKKRNIQGGPKVVTPAFRLIAWIFIAQFDTYLVNIM